MTVKLDDVFDSIIFREGITKKTPFKIFRVVIPVLSFKRAKYDITLKGCSANSLMQFNQGTVDGYKGYKVRFEIWKDFYDFDGDKNSKHDRDSYLLQYSRILIDESKGSHVFRFTAHYKEVPNEPE